MEYSSPQIFKKQTLLTIITLSTLIIVATNPVMASNKHSKTNYSNSTQQKRLTLFTVFQANRPDQSDLERNLIALVNQERAKAGLNELTVDSQLVRLAETKSLDMVAHNYFGHKSDRLGTVYNQLRTAGLSYGQVAENLIGAPNYQVAHEKLNASPGHRANLLNPLFKKIGVAVVRGGPYGFMITEIFTD